MLGLFLFVPVELPDELARRRVGSLPLAVGLLGPVGALSDVELGVVQVGPDQDTIGLVFKKGTARVPAAFVRQV